MTEWSDFLILAIGIGIGVFSWLAVEVVGRFIKVGGQTKEVKR